MSPSRRDLVYRLLVSLASLASAGRIYGCGPALASFHVPAAAVHLDGGAPDGPRLNAVFCAELCGDGIADPCVAVKRPDGLPEVYCHVPAVPEASDAGAADAPEKPGT